MKEIVKVKLLDLYAISPAEAKFHWLGKPYESVLKDKIEKAEKLKRKLLDVDMMKRDNSRITRVAKAVSFNKELLNELGE